MPGCHRRRRRPSTRWGHPSWSGGARRGGSPWTLRQVVDALGELGWTEANARGGWLLVRTWLKGWPSVLRVGREYWVMAERLPGEPKRTRLGVVPVFAETTDAAASDLSDRDDDGGSSDSLPAARAPAAAGPKSRPIPAVVGPVVTHWTLALRTVHLLEGFLPVPAEARAAYPPHPPGAGRWEAVRGKWFDTDKALWLWLDRENDRLCGPDLAEELAWCEAGQRLRITWTRTSWRCNPPGPTPRSSARRRAGRSRGPGRTARRCRRVIPSHGRENPC